MLHDQLQSNQDIPMIEGQGGVMIPQNKGPLYNALHKSTNQLLI